MTYEITLKTLAPQPMVSRRARTARADLAKTIGQLLGSVGQHLAQQGAAMAGPPFTRYHATGDLGHLEVEAGVPVAAALQVGGAGADEIVAGELPGGEAARTLHVGPYEGLPDASAALEDWAVGHGREASGPVWEVYLTDPGAEPDPSRWQTEVFLPLR